VKVTLVWEDPPLRTDHKLIATMLREKPGEWARIDKAFAYNTARNTVYRIRIGAISPYAPAGDFEAVRQETAGEHFVYVRYLGDGVTDE
jgi:hypothetical protein